jgi:hypothetical protein
MLRIRTWTMASSYCPPPWSSTCSRYSLCSKELEHIARSGARASTDALLWSLLLCSSVHDLKALPHPSTATMAPAGGRVSRLYACRAEALSTARVERIVDRTWIKGPCVCLQCSLLGWRWPRHRWVALSTLLRPCAANLTQAPEKSEKGNGIKD